MCLSINIYTWIIFRVLGEVYEKEEFIWIAFECGNARIM